MKIYIENIEDYILRNENISGKKDDTMKKLIIEYSGSNIFKSEEYMQESNDIMSAVERMLAEL